MVEIPLTATYKLEVWGAQDGNGTFNTYGYGGYSAGNVKLEKGTTLYVVVGGAGVSKSDGSTIVPQGGYNGGGTGLVTSVDTSHRQTGGGGSDYLSPKLIEGTTSMVNGERAGDGYAQISIVKK